MLAYRLLSQTVDDVLGNFTAALRISLPTAISMIALVIAVLAGSLLAAALAGTPTSATDAAGTQDIRNLPGWVTPASLAVLVLAVVMMSAAFCWTAVAWHRLIVLGEKPAGMFPRWPGQKVWGYATRVIGITLVLMFIGFLLAPLAFLGDTNPDGTVTVMAGALPDPPTAKNIAIGFVAGTILGGISLQFSMILPAYAVGLRLPTGATAGQFFRCFVPLAILLNVMFIAMDTSAALFPLGGVTGIVMIWLQLLIGIGVLTRLYVHYVPPAPSEATA